jgi:hypothetical protein
MKKFFLLILGFFVSFFFVLFNGASLLFSLAVGAIVGIIVSLKSSYIEKWISKNRDWLTKL